MRKTWVMVALALLSMLASPAFADDERPDKRESVGTALAIGGTAAGPVLILIANRIAEKAANDDGAELIGVVGGVFVMVGPSLGHWYAGKPVTWGMGLRVGGLAAGGIGLLANYSCIPESTTCGHRPLPIALMVAGGAALLTGTIWDLLTADDQVRHWNSRHAVTVAPVPLGNRGAGFALVGTF